MEEEKTEICPITASRFGEQKMSKPYHENLHKTMRLTDEMLALADEGDRDRIDASCGILYGIMRDMAYKLRRLVEQEYENHETAERGD